MTIKVYPTKMCGYDGIGDCVFTLDTFDEVCATLKIDTSVSPAYWPELSEAILAALKQMFPPEEAGCDHCNHPLYAAIKCSQCGRVTE